MIILIQCSDKIGLVAGISKVVSNSGANIISMREHVEKNAKRFFARVVTEGKTDVGEVFKKLKEILPNDALITINPIPNKKIIVLVSKEYHCLGDILLRNSFSALGATVQAVIGNHKELSELASRFSIPFHYISYEDTNADTAESNLLKVVNSYHADYLVLAKFMRILSPRFIEQFTNRIINIHHSFLPAFAGANPYKQAFERGVKLIGATSHFVTNELDDGPIIAQQIVPVNHSYTAKDMVRAGKEIETTVLAKALQLVFEDRVMVFNNKTIVFE